MRSKTSRKLVSEDRKNNVHRNQWTLVVEIAPLCKVRRPFARLPSQLLAVLLADFTPPC